jgi:hypothetical protein
MAAQESPKPSSRRSAQPAFAPLEVVSFSPPRLNQARTAAFVVVFCMDLVPLDDGTFDVKPRMAARERGVRARARELADLGYAVELIFCGGRTRGIPASQSSISAMRVRKELGQLADTMTFHLDEQSTNTLENLVEAWKIIKQRTAHATTVPITFVTDISHLRAMILPLWVFRAQRYDRDVRTESFESNLAERFDNELAGLQAALEALQRCDPHFELAPAIYREIVRSRNTGRDAKSVLAKCTRAVRRVIAYLRPFLPKREVC